MKKGRSGFLNPFSLLYLYCNQTIKDMPNIQHKGTGTKEYRAWSSIKTRCVSGAHISYKNYGGRGIKMCDRWVHSFPNFLFDMGKAPSIQHSIDRIDNDGDYEPSNCRWSTKKEQGNNRRTNIVLTYKGKSKTLMLWCVQLGIDHGTILKRIRGGWTVSDALSKPVDKRFSHGAAIRNSKINKVTP